MHELRPGLWHWEAPHPQWEPTEPWGPSVSSYAIDDGRRLLLFDPLALPDELEALAADCETAIVLTAPWHERDTQSLVERIDAPVYVPPPDTQEDLMETYGVTAQQAAGVRQPGCPLAAGRRLGRGAPVRGRRSAPHRSRGVPGQKRNDMVLWIQSLNTVIAGDTLVDWGQGLQINPRWLREDMTREQVAGQLRPLLERPVEHVLPTHGGPTGRAALEHALS